MRFLNHTLLVWLALILQVFGLTDLKPPPITPNGYINTPLNTNVTFKSCDAKQQSWLRTLMYDVHTLTVLGQHAAELMTWGSAPTIPLYGKRTDLTPDTAYTLLEEWLGHGDMKLMPNATMELFREVEDIFTKGHAWIRFNCEDNEGECDAHPRSKEVGYVYQPIGEDGDLWWKGQEIKICDKFWNRPTLDQVLHGDDVKGNDTLPASWVMLDEFVMPIVNGTRKEEFLDIFNDCIRLVDAELPAPDVDPFLRAQLDANACNAYAFHQYDAWPGYAVEIAEAAYKGNGHVPASSYGTADEKE